MILARGSYGLVDAVAESHQPAVAALDPLDELRDVVDRADLLQHPQHGFVRAAVQRTVERRGGAGQRRVRIDVRAADVAHRARRAVLLVIGVQDEQHVERPLERRVRLVLQLGHLEQHVQEVAGEAQVVVGIDVRAADAVAVGIGGNRRHLRDQPVDLLLARLLVEDLLAVRDRTSRARPPCSRTRPWDGRRR